MPTIGLILCTDKNDAMMKNMLGNGDQQIFAIRYERPDRSDVQDHHGATETLRHALGRR